MHSTVAFADLHILLQRQHHQIPAVEGPIDIFVLQTAQRLEGGDLRHQLVNAAALRSAVVAKNKITVYSLADIGLNAEIAPVACCDKSSAGILPFKSAHPAVCHDWES